MGDLPRASSEAPTVATCYHCSNCGAPNRERARHCSYCRQPIATVRCADCHQLNAPEALHCSGCGYALGLEPIYGDSELDCTACTGKLSCFRAPSGRLYDCKRCGGQFVEQALLRQLLERREVAGALLPRKARQHNPLEQPLVYRACPACRQIMHRRNFGGTSGIIVDVCAMHGLWFDAGELPQVLKFVEDGGLALARRLQAEGSLVGWKLPDKPPARFEIYRDSFQTPKPEPGLFETVASVGIGLLELLSGA